MEFKAHGYQEKAIEKILHQKKVGLFLDLGLGKTIITLTAVNCLLENFAISKCLVIAPKLVAENTWSTEAAKWNHTKGMVVSKIIGSRAKREKAPGTHGERLWLIQTGLHTSAARSEGASARLCRCISTAITPSISSGLAESATSSATYALPEKCSTRKERKSR